MKKIFICFICLCITCVYCFSACTETDVNTVKLVAVDVNSVGLLSDIDYYVVPEPAASTKVKAIKDLNFAGDLQQLYDGESGYPQAVVVAKNELLGTAFLSQFTASLYESDKWLNETSIETIVGAVQDYLMSGLEPTIRLQNLTREVIENCGIDFVSAVEEKKEILNFMQKLNAVSGNAFGIPSDEFFFETIGENDYNQKVSVYAPDGAPALGIAKLMFENTLKNVEYNIVNPNTVQALVGGVNPKADICVLPVNIAVKLLGDAKKYHLIGTLTHGNLFLLANSEQNINGDLHKLKGQTVGVVNLTAVPGLTFKLILKDKGINYLESYND